MEKIGSFQIDHSDLHPGIYLSRTDWIGPVPVITYDIRMIHVGTEAAVSPSAAHTIEHLGATWLRNSNMKDDVIYWGPMGCLTGFYLIMKNDRPIGEVKDMIMELMDWISKYDGEIPGASPEECGNFTFHNLNEARIAAKHYLVALMTCFRHDYPVKKK